MGIDSRVLSTYVEPVHYYCVALCGSGVECRVHATCGLWRWSAERGGGKGSGALSGVCVGGGGNGSVGVGVGVGVGGGVGGSGWCGWLSIWRIYIFILFYFILCYISNS